MSKIIYTANHWEVSVEVHPEYSDHLVIQAKDGVDCCTFKLVLNKQSAFDFIKEYRKEFDRLRPIVESKTVYEPPKDNPPAAWRPISKKLMEVDLYKNE